MWIHCASPIDFTDGAPQTIDPTAVGLVKLLAKRKAIEMLPLGGSDDSSNVRTKHSLLCMARPL